MQSSFHGIITPTLTPFTEAGEIYEAGFENLFSFLAESGVHGVFSGGSYAAFPLLSDEERMRVTSLTIALAKKYELKVIAHIGHASTHFSVKLARFAEGLGADAVASVLPYYYSGHAYTDENYLLHFTKIKDAVSCPVHVYNNPRTTKVAISPELLKQLQLIGISGMKDSGSDMDQFRKYADAVWCENDRTFDLMPGSGSVFLEGFELGAQACVAGTSVVFPDLVAHLYDAIMSGDSEAALTAQEIVNRARDVQQSHNMRPASAYDLLKLRGIDVGVPRAPWRTLSEDELVISSERLSSLGVI